MRKIITILSVLSFSISFSQLKKTPDKLDDLLKRLSTLKQDSARVNVLNKLAFVYNNSNPNEGIKVANEAVILSKKINFKDGLGVSYWSLGINYFAVGDFRNAQKSFDNVLKNSSDKKTMGRAYRGLGLTAAYQNKYADAINNDYKALAISEELNDQIGVASANSNLGIVYGDLKNYNKALVCFQNSLKINQQFNKLDGVASDLYNIGSTYSILKQEQKALEYYQKNIDVCKQLGDNYSLSITLSGIANTQFNLQQYDASIVNANKSNDLAQTIVNYNLVAFNTNLVGINYLQKFELNNNFVFLEKANNSFSEALKINLESNSLKEISENYKYLSEVNSLLKNPALALDNYKLSVKYRDSIFNSDNKETIKNLEDKRSIDLQEKELKINKLTIESNRKQKWFLGFGILFLAIIGGLFFYLSQIRQKTNQKLQVLNADLDKANKTKARFFSILNHDLRSPVSNLINFLHLQRNNPEMLDEKTKNRMQTKTIASAENLLISMEDMLLWSKSQMENFEPQPEKILVSSIFNDTKNHFASEEKIKFIFENNENLEIFTDDNYLKTIIRNLTGNAIKALADSENAKITLKAFTDKNQKYLSITDNGAGAKLENFKALYDDSEVIGIKTGLGLHLIRDLATAINCKITVDSQVGFGTSFLLEL